MSSLPCPSCGEPAAFSKKRAAYYCAECESAFAGASSEGAAAASSASASDSASRVAPQTIFLSYAHRSEREEDFDISEDLVLLVQKGLEQDGHTVWIDKEGIRAGAQWRERITSAILEHAHFLSFLSVRSVRDPGVCLNEIAIALGGHRRIQTVLAEDEGRVAPPLTISHVQWHDFQHWREIRAGTRTGPTGEDWDTWFAQRMTRLREVIADAESARIPGELQQLREILEPKTFEARIVEKTQGFSGRQWLFDETRHWLEKTHSRMLWLRAGPGIGKSSFAAQLAHQARSSVVGFFMCDFQGRKDPEDSAREAVCTLAFQIASRLPDYRLKLLYGQKVDRDKILKRTADELFEFLITEPLNRAGKIPESTRLCLVIDGLDEAGRAGGGNRLSELLARHAQRLPDWLGLLVTSRPEPQLEQILKPLSSIAIDGQSAQNRQDLEDWLQLRLPPSIVGAERQRIIDTVIDKSGGTFLYLSLIDKDPSLDLSRPETLPDQLDGFFKQTFQRYFPDLDAYSRKTEPFLRLMVAAPGPLPLSMGARILGWSRRDLALNVSEPMGSLVEERDGGLRFFHASLPDWLDDPRRSGVYCVNEGGAGALGEFLCGQLDGIDTSPWQSQVADWTVTLLPHTSWWSEPVQLDRVAGFLDSRLRYRSAIVVRRRHLEITADPHWRTPCLAALGRSLLAVSDLHEAERCYVEALAAVERLFGPDDLRVAEMHKGLASVHAARGAYAEATSHLERALKIATLRPGSAMTGEARVLACICERELGVMRWTGGDVHGARKLFEQALASHTEHFGLEHIETAEVLNVFATLTWTSGDYEAALPLYERSLEVSRRVLGPEHPNTARTMNNYGILLVDQGRGSEARPLFDQALRIYDEVFGSMNPHSAMVLTNLGNLHFHEGPDEQSAEECFRRALAIREEVSGPVHNETAGALVSLADLLAGRREDALARKLYDRAIAIYEDVFGDDHADTALARNNLGNFLKDLGYHDEAVRLYSASHRACLKVLGAEHPRTIMAEYSLLKANCAAAGREMDPQLHADLLSRLSEKCGPDHPNTIVVRCRRDFLLQNRCFVRSAMA